MSYQSTRQDLRRAYTIGAAYVILAIVLGIMLFKIWPPVPWPAPANETDIAKLTAFIAETGCAAPSRTITTTADGTPPTGSSRAIVPEIIPISLFWKGKGCLQTTFDERLLLLVIVAGILGAFVHGATSLADFVGNNNFNKSWTWFYLLRPAIGMCLALVFYFVIRGGFLSTTGGAQDINPYGIAALAGLVGMFSKQATDKLSEVFGTLFRSAPGEGDAKRKGALKPETSATIQLEPSSAVAGGGDFKLTVLGSGFTNGAAIHVNDEPQTTTFESSTKLSAQIAKEKIANPVTLKITVVNADKTKVGSADFVVAPGKGAT